MQQKALPKRTVLLWRLRVVMLTILFLGLCFYFSYALPFLVWAALGLGLLSVVVNLFYLPAFFGSYEISTKKDAMIINYGVFIKISHVMPYSRLIYAQTFATPLARIFGLTAISLKAARSRVIIPEIKTAQALSIMKHLSGESKND